MHIRVEEISRRLADKAESVCQMLLPGGKPVRGDWVAGDVDGGEGQSLKVHLNGQHAGKWRDWASGEEFKGDLIDLWRWAKNCSPAEAVKEAKAYLGIMDPVHQHSQKNWAKPKLNGSYLLKPKGKSTDYLTVDRKLTPEILGRFKVEADPHAGAIIFPCYSPTGDLINRSFRTLPKDGEKKKVWQDAGCAPCLFGWQALDEKAYQDRTVMLCEGQIDCMTWHQWGVDCLSIPNGTGTSWIEYEWDNLEPFDNIYIAFDSDGAGQENANKVIERLGSHRCLVVKIPYKDANEALKEGCTAKDAGRWLLSARPRTPKDMVSGSELSSRIKALSERKYDAFTLPIFKGDRDGEGLFFEDGQLTIWLGDSGHGKSTFMNYLSMCAIFSGKKVFIGSFEVPAEITIKRMLEACVKTSQNPVSEDQVLGHIGDKIFLADIVDFVAQEKLFELMRFAFARHGVAMFVIDSLMRVDGLEEDYPAQTKFMNRLQGFCKEHKVHTHLIVHPRKVSKDGISGNDIRGSGLIKASTDNLCILQRNMKKRELIREGKTSFLTLDQMWDTEIVVDKNRYNQWEGKFQLKFHPNSYTFSKMSK